MEFGSPIDSESLKARRSPSPVAGLLVVPRGVDVAKRTDSHLLREPKPVSTERVGRPMSVVLGVRYRSLDDEPPRGAREIGDSALELLLWSLSRYPGRPPKTPQDRRAGTHLLWLDVISEHRASLHLPARDIPVPTSLSPEAQRVMAMPAMEQQAIGGAGRVAVRDGSLQPSTGLSIPRRCGRLAGYDRSHDQAIAAMMAARTPNTPVETVELDLDRVRVYEISRRASRPPS